MAKKREDLAAAKAKKQKIILIVGGVLLLAVAAIQVPKLMKGSTPPEAAPATGEVAPAATAAVAATATTSAGATVTVARSSSGAVVAGVALPRAAAVQVAPSQLASFTLFEVKDPFVQQDAVPAAGSTIATDSGSAPGAPPAGAASSASPEAKPAAAVKPPPIIYATIDLDGKPQQVQVKQKFPAGEPLFVLRSLTKTTAKIGVAGGSFDDGQAVTLTYGKKLTLVNTATGVRYVLRLAYTGAAPETIEGFTTKGAGQPATANVAAPGTTTTTSAP